LCFGILDLNLKMSVGGLGQRNHLQVR
jgi:hypothetical protein